MVRKGCLPCVSQHLAVSSADVLFYIVFSGSSPWQTTVFKMGKHPLIELMLVGLVKGYVSAGVSCIINLSKKGTVNSWQFI